MHRNLWFNKHVLSRDLCIKVPQGESLKIKKLTVHLSFKDQGFDSVNYLLPAIMLLEGLSNSKGKVNFCRQPQGYLNLQGGEVSGISLDLRGEAMYVFLGNLSSLLLPTLKAFEGFSRQAFDRQGNYHFKLGNVMAFKEAEGEYEAFYGNRRKAIPREGGKFLPMDLSLHTSAASSDEGKVLLTGFQLPFPVLSLIAPVA